LDEKRGLQGSFKRTSVEYFNCQLNYLIDDYSNVQEAKYIGMAKDNADETNGSDQDNETTNESFMGIVANAT